MGYTAIVDYGVGNLKSVSNAMAYIGQRTLITGDAAGLERADAVILPGVGAFPDAADKLRQTGLDQAVLAQAGLTMENVIKTTVFLKDMNDFAAMNEVYASFFTSEPPARSAVEVARLPKDAMVEIEAVAVR